MGSIATLSTKQKEENPRSVFMIRNGINDFMDYLAIIVVIFIPTTIGTEYKIHDQIRVFDARLKTSHGNFSLLFRLNLFH